MLGSHVYPSMGNSGYTSRQDRGARPDGLLGTLDLMKWAKSNYGYVSLSDKPSKNIIFDKVTWARNSEYLKPFFMTVFSLSVYN